MIEKLNSTSDSITVVWDTTDSSFLTEIEMEVRVKNDEEDNVSCTINLNR